MAGIKIVSFGVLNFFVVGTINQFLHPLLETLKGTVIALIYPCNAECVSK